MLHIILDINWKKILLLVILSLLVGCEQQDLIYFTRYYLNCTIYVQPYEDFTKKEAEKIVPILEEQFESWIIKNKKWKFKVLDPISLPKESKVNDRYRASTILDFQNKNLKEYEMVIGLTHKDICTDIHGFKNYGIAGLSYCPGNVCVISDKRLRNKSLIWKIILHEFIHTFGVKHCSNDDPKCYMKDAKGHLNLEIQEYLCENCKNNFY